MIGWRVCCTGEFFSGFPKVWILWATNNHCDLLSTKYIQGTLRILAVCALRAPCIFHSSTYHSSNLCLFIWLIDSCVSSPLDNHLHVHGSIFLMLLWGKGIEFAGERWAAGDASPLQWPGCHTPGATSCGLWQGCSPLPQRPFVWWSSFLSLAFWEPAPGSSVLDFPDRGFSPLWWPPRREEGVKRLFSIIKRYVHSLYPCLVFMS